MWVGLLIFYVANEANVANVFCRILRHILPYFAAAYLAQKPYLCIEFQSALKSHELINLLTNQHLFKNHGICRNNSCREQLGKKSRQCQSRFRSVLPRCSRSDAGGVSERYLRHPQRRHGEELQPPRGHESAGVL